MNGYTAHTCDVYKVVIMTEFTISQRDNPRDKATVLRPQQQNSSLRIRRCADFRSQRMLKYPEICHFHSLAEFYHAALLEGDAAVDAYVPQPFRLRLGRTSYIPDIYYVRDGQRYVAELKPRAEFDETLCQAVSAYFAKRGITFLVIDNEASLVRAMEAQNWLMVVRWILTYRAVDTQQARLVILQRLLADGEIAYGEVADLGSRTTSLIYECAIHRMLHSGELVADFDQQFFGIDTRLSLC
jgi:hypothetical protein